MPKAFPTLQLCENYSAQYASDIRAMQQGEYLVGVFSVCNNHRNPRFCSAELQKCPSCGLPCQTICPKHNFSFADGKPCCPDCEEPTVPFLHAITLYRFIPPAAPGQRGGFIVKDSDDRLRPMKFMPLDDSTPTVEDFFHRNSGYLLRLTMKNPLSPQYLMAAVLRDPDTDEAGDERAKAADCAEANECAKELVDKGFLTSDDLKQSEVYWILENYNAVLQLDHVQIFRCAAKMVLQGIKSSPLIG